MSSDATLRPLTPSQTVGPFFHDCLLRPGVQCDALAGEHAAGQRIHVHGSVLDGDGVPVPDAVLELWQADERGVYHHPADPRWTRPTDVSEVSAFSAFSGFGRIGTDHDGRFSFTSIQPGRVPCGGDHDQAPHISIAVFARGLLNHLFTRMYFPDEPGNETDPMLRGVPANRRPTLIARAVTPASTDGRREYRFDIVLQGRDETVFFAMA
jgi:protocatechuate 3,4-dioxygenase, alpha subunit